jgi:hypothetical protein
LRREYKAYVYDGYEDIGGKRTLDFWCVRVRRDLGRDPGGAPVGTHPLIGSRTQMANDATGFVLWGIQQLSSFEPLFTKLPRETVWKSL